MHPGQPRQSLRDFRILDFAPYFVAKTELESARLVEGVVTKGVPS